MLSVFGKCEQRCRYTIMSSFLLPYFIMWNCCTVLTFAVWLLFNHFQPLAEQGRVLVGEGVLTKMCRKKPKARQFFLFNDILVYGNIVINKKKYNKQHVIPLEEVKLESLKDEGRKYLNFLFLFYQQCAPLG